MKRTKRIYRFNFLKNGDLTEGSVECDVEHTQENLNGLTEEVLRKSAEELYGCTIQDGIELRDFTYESED